MDEQREVGIGGVLLLVAFGRVLSPFLLASGLYRSVEGLRQPNVWAALTAPGAPAYHPLWGGLLIYEVVGQISFLLKSLLLLYLLFRRHRAFPPTMIA